MAIHIYSIDFQFKTKNPYYGQDKFFTTLPLQYKLRVHHPALLKLERTTDQGNEIIFDDLSSLEEGYIESDVEFPIDLPSSIIVTIITGKSYSFHISQRGVIS